MFKHKGSLEAQVKALVKDNVSPELEAIKRKLADEELDARRAATWKAMSPRLKRKILRNAEEKRKEKR